jgi:hypothetical protein
MTVDTPGVGEQRRDFKRLPGQSGSSRARSQEGERGDGEKAGEAEMRGVCRSGVDVAVARKTAIEDATDLRPFRATGFWRVARDTLATLGVVGVGDTERGASA